MNKKNHNLKSTMLITVTYLIVIGFVCVLLVSRIDIEIEKNVIKDAAARAELTANILNDNFSAELEQLSEASAILQKSADGTEYIKYLEQNDKYGASYGVLKLNGEALEGEALVFSEYPAILESFRGNSAVSYNTNNTIIFTVPVFNDQNVKYVLYKVCSCESLAEKFSFDFGIEKTSAIIADIDGNVIMDFNSTDNFRSESIKNAAGRISKEIAVSPSAAVRFKDGGDAQCLFAAELAYADFYLVGVTPYDSISNGINIVRTLVIWTFGLLGLLLITITVYLFGVEQKAKESDELREAKTIAENASRAKSDFLANMSHEIRTPINAVIGMNEMIMRESNDNTVLEYADNIRKASRSLLSIINDILDFSKIESGKMDITEQTYSLNDMLQNIVNMIKIKSEAKKLAFKISIDENLPASLKGDDVRVTQIILNLLNNAVKYTHSGSVSLTVDGEKNNDSILLRISVKDTGIGIKESDMSSLFEDFQRLDINKNRNIEGTGLGLAITYNLAQLMNGRIEVSSIYGEGSEFVVYLPQKIIGDGVIGKFEENIPASKYRYQESFTAPDAEILVVDDNEMNLIVAKNLLKKTLIKITECRSGKEALEVMKQKKFDVILLDHMMPEMDGIETLKVSKSMEGNLNADVPVIALTANVISGVREMYLAAGFKGYIGKPIDGELFEETLRSFISPEKIKPCSSEASDKNSTPDQTSSVSCFDPALGVKYCGDSEETYHEILEVYCEMYEEQLSDFEKFIGKCDWKNYTINIHALKSNSLNIGAEALSKRCLELEKAGKAISAGDDPETKVAFIRTNHPDVMKIYGEVVEKAKKYLE